MYKMSADNSNSDPSFDRDPKQDARNSRLSTLRKTNEEVLRKKLQTQAKKKCDPFFKDFADCAKENGLLVIFNCREQNRASMFMILS